VGLATSQRELIVNLPKTWFSGEIKTPPFSQNARLEAGFLLRKLQKGEMLSLPQSRPMPPLEFDAMNYGLMTKIQLGELSIVLTLMLLLYLTYSKKKRNVPLSKLLKPVSVA